MITWAKTENRTMTQIDAMIPTRNDIRPRNNRSLWNAFLSVVLIMFCILVVQCNQHSPVEQKSRATAPKMVVQDGYAIQLFTSPEEQLRYARAWFSDPQEKRAALKVLIANFPDASQARAESELEMAYLALGSDYRFATPDECRRAIDQYQRVLNVYHDMPFISAKANWYIGWILGDLLKQPREAIAYYQAIVANFPETTLNLKPPVPWVSMVLPQIADRPREVYERPAYFWAGIALLEIIRLSDINAEKWSAFQKLWSDYRDSLATAYAIRELINGPPTLVQKTAVYARAHLDAKDISGPLEKEIRAALRNASFVKETAPSKPYQGEK